MATHSSILAWRIPWSEEPGRLQSTGSQTVRYDWATSRWKWSAALKFFHLFYVLCIKLILTVTVLVTQSCPALCNSMNYIPCQTPLSMEFSRQEYWSGLPFPSPGDLPDPGIKPRSPALQTDSLPSKPPRKPQKVIKLGDKNFQTTIIKYVQPFKGKYEHN